MNSLPDDFDKKLDELLSQSVQAGSQPDELPEVQIPVRPRIDRNLIWALILSLFAGGALVIRLFFLESISGIVLADHITLAVEYFVSPNTLMYAAAMMLGVYSYAFSKIIRLYKCY